jgi:vitamin B12 transporter
LQYRTGQIASRLQWFRTRYRDLIGYDAGFNRVNVGAASTRGVELSLEVPLGAWTAKLAATVQDAVDDGTGERLIRRARRFGDLQLARAAGALDLQANLRASGDRRDLSGGAEHMLGGYGLVDLAARWRVRQDMVLTLRVENALDHAYENAYGYRGTPRGVFGGVELRL